MENNFGFRIRKAWNAFLNRDLSITNHTSGSYYRPDRVRLTRGNERSTITAVINNIFLLLFISPPPHRLIYLSLFLSAWQDPSVSAQVYNRRKAL